MTGYFTGSDISTTTVTTPLLGDVEVTFEPEETSDRPEVTFGGFGDLMQTSHVEFINLREDKIFYKKQCRKKGLARQVVTNGVVLMKAKYNTQLLKIRGWVRREPKAARLFEDHNGPVLICGDDNRELNLIKKDDIPNITEDGHTLQPFSIDLGDIYDGPQGPVFTLAKSDMRKKNRFQLIIQLVFVDDQTSQKFTSPVFMCCTKKRTGTDDANSMVEGEPAPKIDRGNGDLEAQSPWQGSLESERSDSSIRHKKILVDVLNAKTAYIEDLIISKDTHIETSKADIAYHLKMKKLCAELEEGDIVGFYGDEESGETYIQPLRSNNIHTAVHAGVVSRSHWMEGNKPSDKGIVTDTVCVIGIVNVKVVGSIENGERIYASRDHPGKAIPQSHMPVGSFLRKKHVLLGMALESKKASRSLDEVNLTKCFVCIVLDVSRKELLEEIEELYIVNEKKTEEQIKKASKKTWRRLKCCFALTFVTIALIIFMLYQWLAPGSMFRYWLCRRGAIPDHELHFTFKDSLQRYPQVRGLQFTYDGLQDKVGFNFNKSMTNNTADVGWLKQFRLKNEHDLKFPKDEGYYYLNVDRCAYYWTDGAAGNNIGGHKYIGGGRVLSVFGNCSVVYEYAEQLMEWTLIKDQRNVRCAPIPG